MIDRALLAASDFTPVRSALLRALDGDAAGAIVLTRIAWRCEGPQAVEGWWAGTNETIADETGLSVDQVYRAINRLKKSKHLNASKRHNDGPWDQTMSYQPNVGDLS